MAVEKYYNIDNENDSTSWWCPAYDNTYRNMGYDQKYEQSYTKVKLEIPKAVDIVSAVIEDYWSNAPAGKTKFSVSRAFLTVYDPYNPDPATDKNMKVFLDGREVSYSMITANSFAVEEGLNNGYLWVEYVPAGLEATVGDNRTSMKVDGLEVELVLPEIDAFTLERPRAAINNMEKYFSMVPTRWIGGATNTLLSSATNIVKSKTPIYLDHIMELRSAVGRIEAKIDTLVPITFPRYSFTETDYSEIYMIQYIEEIMQAILSIEAVILDPNYYGG